MTSLGLGCASGSSGARVAMRRTGQQAGSREGLFQLTQVIAESLISHPGLLELT